MARPRGGRAIGGWFMTPRVMEKAGLVPQGSVNADGSLKEGIEPKTLFNSLTPEQKTEMKGNLRETRKRDKRKETNKSNPPKAFTIADDIVLSAEKEGTLFLAPFRVDGKLRPAIGVRLNYENRGINKELGGKFDYLTKSWVVTGKTPKQVKEILTKNNITPNLFVHSSIANRQKK